MIEKLIKESLELLRNLIRTQSFSKEEAKTAHFIPEFFEVIGVHIHRKMNNVWACLLYTSRCV